MTLLHHHQTGPRNSATIPFWSLTLPHWAQVRATESRSVREPERATWRCAKCGAVVNGISAAADHIELHRLQERQRRASPR
jgi:hypothetical protein